MIVTLNVKLVQGLTVAAGPTTVAACATAGMARIESAVAVASTARLTVEDRFFMVHPKFIKRRCSMRSERPNLIRLHLK